MTLQNLRRLHWIASQQFGIDLRRLARMPRGLWRFSRDLVRFNRMNTYPLKLQPCLHDWWEQAGAVDNEYFWQDLFVARRIHQDNPKRHVDVGSRLDGFVAHLASFRDVEVFDVRELAVSIPGVIFRQANMMDSSSVPEAYADSVSCLHAIEHFGLGRYGDPLAENGVELGFQALAKILQKDGQLYLACPLGNDTVYFNAHRSLLPKTIQIIARKSNLELSDWWTFNSSTKEIAPRTITPTDYQHTEIHTLAIYLFRKLM